MFVTSSTAAQVHLLIDQVGYETSAPKQTVIEGTKADRPRQFALINADTRKTVFHADPIPEEARR
ncbi:cellulase N-terminal Ig-like domain-containing protein [Alloacidobacterium sp.]|uniref:cellulase N-terminal Ig-like domain-containing protein n=1 Tax=Alloacidobacterium sp. TaxID=2951999 RepID=UPI0039C89804